MKKAQLSILIFLSILFNVKAQEATTNKSNAGLKRGYSLAAVTFDDDGETEQRHGFHIGFYGKSF